MLTFLLPAVSNGNHTHLNGLDFIHFKWSFAGCQYICILKNPSVELLRELRQPASVNFKALTRDAISLFVYSERHLLFAFLSRLSLIFIEFTTWKSLESTTVQSQRN